mmetsp:Transcript_12559/g.46933  ORF Transcript_12559/g.46933 Transcript_12559/m.46933 type:complete len:229 (+) Transcript_12559:523-1209(+)
MKPRIRPPRRDIAWRWFVRFWWHERFRYLYVPFAPRRRFRRLSTTCHCHSPHRNRWLSPPPANQPPVPRRAPNQACPAPRSRLRSRRVWATAFGRRARRTEAGHAIFRFRGCRPRATARARVTLHMRRSPRALHQKHDTSLGSRTGHARSNGKESCMRRALGGPRKTSSREKRIKPNPVRVGRSMSFRAPATTPGLQSCMSKQSETCVPGSTDTPSASSARVPRARLT